MADIKHVRKIEDMSKATKFIIRNDIWWTRGECWRLHVWL